MLEQKKTKLFIFIYFSAYGHMGKGGKCIVCDFVTASFGFLKKKPTHCDACRSDEMTRSYSEQCLSCSKYASFGIEKTRLTHCAKHKEESMLCWTSFACKCRKGFKTYNYEGCEPLFCSECKTQGMVILKSKKKCVVCQKTQARYGLDGGKASHCKKHKDDTMLFLASGACQCRKKIATYGHDGGKPICCRTCRTPEMVNVVTKKCVVCGIYNAVYAQCGLKNRTHCGTCKTPEMVDPFRKICEVCHVKQASYGTVDGKPLRCFVCKTFDMFRVYGTFCRGKDHPEGKHFRTCVDPKYGSLCAMCRSGCVRHGKEFAVGCALEDSDLVANACDKAVGGNVCSKYRPDFYFETPVGAVILEVDEEQHITYAVSCEAARMIEIWQTLAFVPVLFVRFNPDCKEYKKRLTDVLKTIKTKILSQKIEDGLSVQWIGYSVEREKECQAAFTEQYEFARNATTHVSGSGPVKHAYKRIFSCSEDPDFDDEHEHD